MFSTFTIGFGALLIPTARITSIADRYEGCFVSWEAGGDIQEQRIEGTARENFDRMREEELAMMSAAAERQQRYERGLPILPVPRGKAARS